MLFPAEPDIVYRTLLSSKAHSAFTDSPATCSDKEGGKTTAYDGWVEAENLRLIPYKRIVQQWRGSDWPEGHYSEATFEFESRKGSCKLSFTQKGVPLELYDEIASGWFEHYWDKMTAYFIAERKGGRLGKKF